MYYLGLFVLAEKKKNRALNWIVAFDEVGFREASLVFGLGNLGFGSLSQFRNFPRNWTIFVRAWILELVPS